MFHLELPIGAVATPTADRRCRGERPADLVRGRADGGRGRAKKYKELTGIGGYYPKDPALLSWRSQRELALQVFPILAKSTKTVEYTLRMPMEYTGGAYVLHLSALGTAELPARVRFTAADPEEAVLVNGVRSPDRNVRRRVARARGPAQAKGLRSFPRRRARLRLLRADRVLVHARIAAAPRLGQTPNGAAVVVLIDSSISMRTSSLAKSRPRARYLSHFPATTNVEVMTFDRAVSSPFGGALPCVRDRAAVVFTGTPANGSHLDEALARADAKLALSPSAVRRILLFTDLRTREALTADRFAQRTLTSGRSSTSRSSGTPAQSSRATTTARGPSSRAPRAASTGGRPTTDRTRRARARSSRSGSVHSASTSSR